MVSRHLGAVNAIRPPGESLRPGDGVTETGATGPLGRPAVLTWPPNGVFTIRATQTALTPRPTEAALQRGCTFSQNVCSAKPEGSPE